MAQQYGAYSDAVAAMQAQADTVGGLRQDMEAREADFISDWEQRLGQIQNEDLRQRAAERRDAAVQRFDELESESDVAKSTFDPWMTDITDIQIYLQNDLNPDGVASLADVFERVSENAETIKQEVETIVSRLESMIQAIDAASPTEGNSGD